MATANELTKLFIVVKNMFNLKVGYIWTDMRMVGRD